MNPDSPSPVSRLKTYWKGLMAQFHVPAEIHLPVFKELAERHSEPERHYHGLNHILFLLQETAALRDHISDLPLLQFAAFFHDSIYDSKSAENETKSARLAREKMTEMGLPAPLIEASTDLILRTQSHNGTEASADARLFLDLDLAILGVAPHAYQQYMQQVRQEYAWVPEIQFQQERKKILSRFLQRDRIYFSDLLFERLENQARENLQAEINQLSEK